MKEYNIPKTIDAKEIKSIRKEFGMTQKEFAELIGCSKPTVERWETSETKITGPVVLLLKLMAEHSEWMTELEIPPKTLPLRMWYMYKEKRCTLIDVDDRNEVVQIKNYTKNTLFTAFGHEKHPTYEDYCDFLKSRCFPETRDKIKLELDRLGIPFYDPMLIIKKTQGRMAEDDFWILLEE